MLIFFMERVLLFFYFIAGGVDKSFISMGGSRWDRIDFIEIKKPGPKSPGFGWLMPLVHHRRVIG